MENNAVIESTATPISTMSLSGVLAIPAVRQVMLLVGVAASVAAGFAVVLWSQTPGYTRLVGDLDTAGAAQVAESLRGAGIKYKLDTDTGIVLVPEARVHDARLELASQGIPQGSNAGMDMMQEQSSFGVSQFMEGARYQHALEAELAQTISHFGAVRDARVHLAMPKQSAFVRDKNSAGASVFLELYRGRQLEPGQATAIAQLVASSISNLSADNVTLVDQNGHLLSNDSTVDPQANNQLKHSKQLEEDYERKIERMLTALVGPGRVEATVNAKIDYTVTEETRESFDPARSVVRSEEIDQQEQRGSSSAAQGVPGALSNQPPQTVAGDAAQAASQTADVEPSNSTTRSTRNFEVDRTISRVRAQSGTLQKLSVAVVIDDSPGDAEAGEQAGLTPADIERYTSIVKEAVGFDEARGDTVVVISEAFHAMPEAPVAEEPKIWEKPIVRDSLKQVLGAALVLALGFGLVRPMLRGIMAGPAAGGAYAAGAGTVLTTSGPMQLAAGQLAIPSPSFDDKVAAAKNITGHDPARVAQVVRKWVAEDE